MVSLLSLFTILLLTSLAEANNKTFGLSTGAIGNWHQKIYSTLVDIDSRLVCAGACNADDQCQLFHLQGPDCHMGRHEGGFAFLPPQPTAAKLFRDPGSVPFSSAE